MEDLTNKAKEILKKQKGFISANNYEVVKVEENYCELEGIITDTSTNHLGIAHGGYIFGLADTAAGIAEAVPDSAAELLRTADSGIRPDILAVAAEQLLHPEPSCSRRKSHCRTALHSCNAWFRSGLCNRYSASGLR